MKHNQYTVTIFGDQNTGRTLNILSTRKHQSNLHIVLDAYLMVKREKEHVKNIIHKVTYYKRNHILQKINNLLYGKEAIKKML